MNENEKIVYEPHPVTPERKKELRSQGFRILDIRFAPKDHKRSEEQAGKDQGLTVEKAREELTRLGIEYGPRLQLPGLLKLLDKHGEKVASDLAQVKARLAERAIEFNEDASLEDLRKLLDETE